VSFESPSDAGWMWGGGFQWALRGAVAAAGHYDSGTDARSFYVDLARQIDAACDEKRIPCNATSRTIFPSVGLADVPIVFQHFIVGSGELLRLQPLVIDDTYPHKDILGFYPWKPSPIPKGLSDDYQFVTHAVRTLSGFSGFGPTSLRVIAWIYQRLFGAAVLVAIALLVLRLRRRQVPEYGVLLACVALSVLTLLSVLSVIDALSFAAFTPEYVGSMIPLVLFAATVGLTSEIAVASAADRC
jgi:hypothetical protein